jgi:glutathione S-transferase
LKGLLGLGTISTLALSVADAYVLKLILWNDAECVEVLSNMRKAATGRAHVHPAIGDIACFPYTAMAGEGGISLSPCPNIQRWIDRMRQIPRFIPMPGIPAIQAAARRLAPAGSQSSGTGWLRRVG